MLITHFLLMPGPHLKCTCQARIFWVGLLTDMTHTKEYPKVELGGNSYIYKW
jgi:hypothetical protein